MQIEHVAIWTRDLERIRDFYETYILSFDSGDRLEIMQMPSAAKWEHNQHIRRRVG